MYIRFLVPHRVASQLLEHTPQCTVIACFIVTGWLIVVSSIAYCKQSSNRICFFHTARNPGFGPRVRTAAFLCFNSQFFSYLFAYLKHFFFRLHSICYRAGDLSKRLGLFMEDLSLAVTMYILQFSDGYPINTSPSCMLHSFC